MKFINPKTDYAFKKIFGSDDSHDILISFLNAIIYQGRTVIESLEIIDPYAPGRVAPLKTTYFDVKAQLANGQRVLIEMQAFVVPAFSKRMAYNTGKMYVNQLKIGENYPELATAIGVGVIDFIMFKNTDKIISQFILKEETELFDHPQHPFQLVYVELPKFTKKLTELATITDQWLYFLQKAPDLEIIPPQMSNNLAIQKAFTIADRINMTTEELDVVERQEQLIMEQKGSIEFSLEKGIQLGVQMGKIELIKSLLETQIGPLNQDQENRLLQLSSEQLISLGRATFSLSSLTDLDNWLNREIGNTAKTSYI